MLPDLLAENTSGLWTIYVANVLHGFIPMKPLPRSPLAVPHSCAFINLLEDYAAGILNYLQFSFLPNYSVKHVTLLRLSRLWNVAISLNFNSVFSHFPTCSTDIYQAFDGDGQVILSYLRNSQKCPACENNMVYSICLIFHTLPHTFTTHVACASLFQVEKSQPLSQWSLKHHVYIEQCFSTFL